MTDRRGPLNTEEMPKVWMRSSPSQAHHQDLQGWTFPALTNRPSCLLNLAFSPPSPLAPPPLCPPRATKVEALLGLVVASLFHHPTTPSLCHAFPRDPTKKTIQYLEVSRTVSILPLKKIEEELRSNWKHLQGPVSWTALRLVWAMWTCSRLERSECKEVTATG